MTKDKYMFSSLPYLGVVSDEVIESRGKQAIDLIDELLEYKILLRDLVVKSIPSTIKNELLNMAFFITQNIEYYEAFESKKNIPIEILCKNFKKEKSFINRWRDHIVAYTIILGNPRYYYIEGYLKVIEKDDEEIINSVVDVDGENQIKGIVLRKKGKTAIVMTSMGDFMKINLSEDKLLGEEASGNYKNSIKDYNFYISLFISILIVLVCALGFAYSRTSSTLMIKTTSTIMVETNIFNRVKSIKSSTEKGNALIKTIDTLDVGLDESLYRIMKYAKENEMIPHDGISIMVSGNKIKFEELIKTEDFIYVEQINVKFNNAGAEYKLN